MIPTDSLGTLFSNWIKMCGHGDCRNLLLWLKPTKLDKPIYRF